MCAMCDGRSLEEYLHGIEELIDRHGWALQYVESGGEDPDDSSGIDPAFCYTIGMTAYGHPEIVITGRDPAESASALNSLARQVAVGRQRFEAGMRVWAKGFDFYFVDVERSDEWLTIADRMYPPGPVRAVQAVWRSCDGTLPWEGNLQSTIVQPVLGPPPGWYDGSI
ncbi:protein of unknown function [Rhodococcoides kyotonense]|uniref:DUF4262 domain-containing protein n=2 Tax=Rhodococcoides kyotonense TaxID=398843 RepID=A0A239JRN1_9NOCA|nr:protein of unknown function [Rhodococcus kyotonensis]